MKIRESVKNIDTKQSNKRNKSKLKRQKTRLSHEIRNPEVKLGDPKG